MQGGEQASASATATTRATTRPVDDDVQQVETVGEREEGWMSF